MLTAIELGERLAVARKQKNISQTVLAEYLSLTPQAVGKWERGESLPDIITLAAVAEYLGVDLNYFAAPAGEEKKIRSWDMSGYNWNDADFSGLSNLAEKFRGANIKNCLFVGSSLPGLQLSSNNIKGCDFSRADLSGAQIKSSNIHQINFTEANLGGATFNACQLKELDLTAANLSETTFTHSHFNKNITENNLWKGVIFRMSQLTDIVFTGEITDCTFENCDFTRVIFRDAILRQCFFKSAKLKKITFENCTADPLTLAFLKNGKTDLAHVRLLVTE